MRDMRSPRAAMLAPEARSDIVGGGRRSSVLGWPLGPAPSHVGDERVTFHMALDSLRQEEMKRSTPTSETHIESLVADSPRRPVDTPMRTSSMSSAATLAPPVSLLNTPSESFSSPPSAPSCTRTARHRSSDEETRRSGEDT
jgi:hypothetical protein